MPTLREYFSKKCILSPLSWFKYVAVRRDTFLMRLFMGRIFFKGGKFMEYERKDLQSLPLCDLRKIGYAIKVKSSTTLKKEELINQILLVASGAIPPHITNKGRRQLNPLDVEVEKDITIKSDITYSVEQQLEKILEITKLFKEFEANLLKLLNK